MKTRVLHIVADGRPSGGTTVVLALAQAQAESGLEVGLITQTGSPAVLRAGEMNLTTTGVDFFRSRFDLTIGTKLRSITSQFHPHIVHVHGARAGFHFTLVSRSHPSVPVVYTVHGYHFLRKPWALRRLGALAEARISSKADATVFVCEHDRQLALQWSITRKKSLHKVIHNGIDQTSMPMGTNRVQTKLVGFLGRLTYQKDPLLFVDTMKILVKEGYRAVIVGGGELEDTVRRRVLSQGVAEHVGFLGELPHEEALAAIAKVGVLVMTSRWEGLPITLLEAMSMGLPIVAAQVSGIPEIIKPGVTGMLIKQRDPPRYADAVMKIAADHKLRFRIVANGRALVKESFTLDRMELDYSRLYRLLLE